MNTKVQQANRRKGRVRARITGTTLRPRLSVRISNRHITAQIINDETGLTLASATTVKATVKGTMTEKATWLGGEIATAAKKSKIKLVVLDRGSKLYHGRLHALAEAARNGGLEF
jgi:large subunit ribosomal protein L18